VTKHSHPPEILSADTLPKVQRASRGAGGLASVAHVTCPWGSKRRPVASWLVRRGGVVFDAIVPENERLAALGRASGLGLLRGAAENDEPAKRHGRTPCVHECPLCRHAIEF